MANDKKFGVEVIVSATDKASAQFKEINKKIANSGLGKLNNSFRMLSGASGFNQVTKAMGKFGSATSNAASEFSSLAFKLGALAGAGGTGLFLLTKSFADFADNVGDSADKLGMTNAAYQKYSIGAKLAGIETEQFNTSVGKFSKSIGEAAISTTGPMAKTLSNLGVSLRDSKGHLRSMDDLLPETIKKLDGLKNAGIRNTVGMKLFGKSFQNLVPYVKDFARYTNSAQGFILSDKDIERGNKFKDQLVQFSATLGLLKNLAGAELMQGFSDGLAFFQQFLLDNKEQLRSFFKAVGESLPGAFRALAGALQTIINLFSDYDEKTKKTELNFGRMKLAVAGFVAFLSLPFIVALGSAILALGNLVIALGTTLGAIIIFGTGAETVLGGLAILVGMISWPVVLLGVALVAAGVLIYKYWEPIKQLFSDIWGFIVKIGDKWAGIFSKQNFQAAFGTAPNASAAPVSTNFLAPAANPYAQQNASLQVSFANMPKGTKVSSSSDNWGDLLINRGYASGGL
jgi:hypothetical protein